MVTWGWLIHLLILHAWLIHVRSVVYASQLLNVPSDTPSNRVLILIIYPEDFN